MKKWPKLFNADCMDILRKIKPESVDAVITDPPYGIDYQSAWRTESKRKDKIANDKQPFIWWLNYASIAIKPGGCLVCFCRWDVAEAFRLSIGWAGLHIGAQLMWDREIHGMGDPSSRPSPQHDIIWFAVKGKYQLPGDRPSSVYRCSRVLPDELLHPNQKPVSLMMSLVSDYTKANTAVVDPFMGSGTTGVACIQTGRRFIGIEQDEKYFNIAKERIAKCSYKPSLWDCVE